MLLIITESGFKTFQDVFNIMDMNSIMARVMSIPPSPKSPITTTTTTIEANSCGNDDVFHEAMKKDTKEEDDDEYVYYQTATILVCTQHNTAQHALKCRNVQNLPCYSIIWLCHHDHHHHRLLD
mmetsp:Transcript_39766/g.63794  ORF Transcript_39766/g.63794 Transcript_39766/m.63794 type:complete len:124 (+) Transcript_39766:178-549(+)